MRNTSTMATAFFDKTFLAKKVLVPILLLLSIGLSGWTFGPNLIPNPDFSAQAPANWSLPDYQWGLTDWDNGMMNISRDGEGLTQSSPIVLHNDTIYEILLDYKILGGDAPTSASGPFYIINNRSWFGATCYTQFNMNSTAWEEYADICGDLDKHLFLNDTYIEDLGNGWSRLHGYMDMGKDNFTEDINELFWIGSSNRQINPVLIDNFIVQENGTSDNQIANSDFSDAITECSTATWDTGGATCGYDRINPIANLTGGLLMLYPYGGYGEINNGGYYAWSFKFKTDNASGLMQTNMDGASDIYINTTAVCDNDPESYPEEGCIFPSANYLENSTHITSLGDGWYKFETIYFATSGGGLLDNYVEIVYSASVQIDDCKVQLLTYTPDPCQGWECNTLGKMMIQTILALIPFMVVAGIIVLTRPESVLTLAMELVIAGIMSVVMITLI